MNCLFAIINLGGLFMAKRKNIPRGMPAYSDLINPTISALQSLGGSGNCIFQLKRDCAEMC